MNYKEHILIVDDDPALLAQAEEILSEKYTVSLAASGKQAVQFLQRAQGIDLVLLDILMPEMNGFDTLKAIKDIELYKNIPVIFLTSLADSDSELQGLLIGAADYITKPFNSKVLMARVELRLRTGNQLDEKKLAALTDPLTDSELRVARLLARAYSNEEIGNELHYALDTVKKIVSRILDKLDIKSRKEIKKFLK